MLELSGSSFCGLTASLLKKGYTVKARAHGHSMLPSIHDGDIIYLSPIGIHKLSIGDIVSYIRRKRNTLVVHRIVGIEDSCFIVKGDNLGCQPARVNLADIIGWVAHNETMKHD